MSQRIQWHDCLLPRPTLDNQPPKLIDFCTDWWVIDYWGQELKRIPAPAPQHQAMIVKQLVNEFPTIQLSSRMLDLLME